MITNEQVRGIALFFLLALMEERLALQAAHKAIAHLKSIGTNSGTNPTSEIDPVTLIRVLKKTLVPYRKLLTRNRGGITPGSAWKLPDNSDITPWVKFQKDNSENEVIAVILSKVLPFTDQQIAEGLNVSLGTARYRIGKGVRQLGGQFEPRVRRA